MKKKLFVIGRHENLVQRVLEKLNEREYDAAGTANVAELENLFVQHQPVVAVIGGGVELNDRIAYKEKLRGLKPDILFVEHFGSFSSLLDEIKWALD